MSAGRHRLRMTVVGWLILMSAGRADWIEQAPPAFRPLPPIRIAQNSGETRLLDLWEYAIDADTPKNSLLFSVAGPRKYQYEGGANLSIALNRFLIATPTRNWVGDESWSVEVSDGEGTAYAVFRVTVGSSQAGALVEAEDASRVSTRGDWVEREHQGARFVMSNRPGDRLLFRFTGRHLAARVWTGDLRTPQRYYEGRYTNNRYGFLSEWKTYSAGNAEVLIDGRPAGGLDIAARQPGWNELPLGSGLGPGDHELELRVRDGYVMVDRLRSSEAPFAGVEVDVADEYGTPLSDALVIFRRPGSPDIEVRTDHRGRHGTFFGVPPGTYTVAVRSDSNPGYLPADPVDENLAESVLTDVSIRVAAPNVVSRRLSYVDRGLRSLARIRRPVGTVPSLALPGEILRVECLGLTSSPHLSLRIGNGLQQRTLQIEAVEPAPVRGGDGLAPGLHIVARLPSDLAPGLWDLHLTSGEVTDTVTRAVGVLRQGSDSYRFVQISDLHIRNSRRNRAHDDRLIALAQEINLLAPAFVVMTGDLTDVGARSEYLRVLAGLRSFSVPTFAVPGNHDHYSWWTRYLYRGRDEYARYMGDSFYAFSIGRDRYVAVDTSAYEKIHDRDVAGAHADQWSFLTRELGDAGRRPGLMTVFSHYDHTSVLDRRYPISHQLESLIRRMDVDVYLFGHLHRSFEQPVPPLVLATGSTLNGEYRVIEVRDSSVIRHPVLRQGDLVVDYLSNASSVEGQARIENRSAHAFDDLVVQFLLPASPGGYQVDGGRVIDTMPADDGSRARVVVAFNLRAGELRVVRVRPRN